MLFILYGGHTGMGSKSRDFFRENGVQIVKKYHYIQSSPNLTTFYEPRDYVDELTFLKNTNTMYRYSLGNIQCGFSHSQILEAVNDYKDCLLTLSTDRIEIIKNLKDTYGNRVQVIYVYTDDSTLKSIFFNMNISEQEAELRYSIGRKIKECYRHNPSLFDYTIIYGGEESPFDSENIINQCELLYIRSQKQKDDNQEQLKGLREIKNTAIEMEKTLNYLACFPVKELQDWLRQEKHQFKVATKDVDDEYATAAFIAKSDKYITERFSVSDILVKRETSKLRRVFSSTWDRLLPSTQTSLISARVLWQSCADITRTDFDYSGICITLTAALESELKRWFYTKYQDYLLKQHGNPSVHNADDVYSVWPEELLDRSRSTYEKKVSNGGTPVVQMGASEKFTMGMLPYLFFRKKTINQDSMKIYLRSIFKEKYIYELGKSLNDFDNLNSFVNQCEQVRKYYRNPAAHSEVLNMAAAKDCYYRIIGQVIEKADAHPHNSKKQGLILMLYDFLK